MTNEQLKDFRWEEIRFTGLTPETKSREELSYMQFIINLWTAQSTGIMLCREAGWGIKLYILLGIKVLFQFIFYFQCAAFKCQGGNNKRGHWGIQSTKILNALFYGATQMRQIWPRGKTVDMKYYNRNLVQQQRCSCPILDILCNNWVGEGVRNCNFLLFDSVEGRVG